MPRKISIKDVASKAGVSTATVSNVFTGKKAVNPQLAKKIRRVADELGYQVNKVASQLRTGKNSVVSILVPDFADPFFTAIITELEKHAQNDGYEVIVGSSGDDYQKESTRLDALLSWQPAGLVIFPCSNELPTRLSESRWVPPCILVDRVSEFGVHDSVTVDNFEAGKMVGELLLVNGHSKILVAASSMAFRPIADRVRGIKSLVEANGGEISILEIGADPEAAVESLEDWVEVDKMPTAIFSTTDMTTLSVLTFLAGRRIDIPNHVSVVGFDDYPWMKARKTGITAVGQPVEEMASAIWRRLFERMEGHAGPPISTELDCTLVVRDSVLNRDKVKDLGVGNG